jgi:hypothetical protein
MFFRHSYLLISFFICSSFLLTACVKDSPSNGPDDSTRQENQTPSPSIERTIQPLTLATGQFEKVIDWINDEQIIFIINDSGMSKVLLYDIYDGKQKLLYETEHPIVDVQVSPTKNQFLVHTAPFTYAGELTVVNLEGDIYTSTFIESFELSFHWNPHNEHQLLITAFYEDWTYDTYIWNWYEERLETVYLSNPFSKWYNDGDSFLYIDWHTDQPFIDGPLKAYSFKNETETTLLQHVYHVDVVSPYVMTISNVQENEGLAQYDFYEETSFSKIAGWKVPHLSQYTDWLVPFYDYVPKTNRFYTFVPYRSTDSDSYNEGFELVQFSLTSEEKTKIIEYPTNEPIQCAPSGNNCLIGYQLDKIIDLEKKEIKQLIQLEERDE